MDKKAAPLFSVLISGKNSRRWLDKCLSSLAEQSFRNFEIIFVDNVSTDDSVNFIKENFKDIKIVLNQVDLGFAGGNNTAAAHAKGKYLVLMNTDAYLEKTALEKLSKYLNEHPKAQLMQVCEKDYYAKKLLVDEVFMSMDIFGYPISSTKKMFYADGAGLVIVRKLFNQLGGFDQGFYMYLEDVDLSWRARLLGVKILYLPEISMYHFSGGTSEGTHAVAGSYTTTIRRRFHAQKNNLRMLLKNYSLLNLLWALPISVALASAEGFLYLIKGNKEGFLALHNSIWWNITNLRKTLRLRQITQRTRLVSDLEILRACEPGLSKFKSLTTYGIPKLK